MIENTCNYYEKLEKEMCDMASCYITFTIFPWNPILRVMDKKKLSMGNEEKMEQLTKPIVSFSNFP